MKYDEIYKDEFEGQALVDISAIHELHKVYICYILHIYFCYFLLFFVCLFSSTLVNICEKIEHSEKGVRLGGAATCNKLIEVLEEMSKVYPKQQSYFSAFITHINKIAGTPVC